MSIGFVIGNGESRKNFDIRRLQLAGSTYGCNAIHRDYNVSHLICLERKHLVEAMQWHLHKKQYVYTTDKNINLFKNPLLELFPAIPYENSHIWDTIDNFKSGPAALLLASMQHSIVIVFGFDFEQSNNIYANSDNYSPNKRDGLPYIHQTSKIIRHFTDVKYVFVNDRYDLPDKLLNYENVCIDTYENLEDQLLT